jgi:predicted dienelactone hydrolase
MGAQPQDTLKEVRMSLFRTGVLLAFALTAAPTIAATLPAPDGPYAVGFRRFELTDTSRKGIFSKDPNEARVLPAYVWYPAKADKTATRPYIPAVDLADNGAAIARGYDDKTNVGDLSQWRAHSVENAPVLKDHGKYPIVIFSHGYGLYALQNTVQMEEWASHGYIVISIAHPYDGYDIRLSDGRLLPRSRDAEEPAELKVHQDKMCCGANHETRTAGMKGFGEALAPSRQGKSGVVWREDMMFTVHTLQKHAMPASVRDVTDAGNANNYAITGMSSGGDFSAAACHRAPDCKAAINLDGGSHDAALFDADIGHPLLMLHSNWVRYPLGGRPADPNFVFNDYAYERWTQAGLNKDVIRVSTEYTRHLGLTDLLLLVNGPKKSELVGAADPVPTMTAISKVTLAFLDEYLKGGSRAALDATIAHSPIIHRHDPSQVREWAREHKASLRP